jgi:hypothetical protein
VARTCRVVSCMTRRAHRMLCDLHGCLGFRVRREFTTLYKYRSLSRQHSGVSPSPQSALGSPQSAEVGVGRRPRRRSLFYTRLYTDYSIGFSLLYAYGTRTHGFLRYGFTLFKHGLRISLHEIHT